MKKFVCILSILLLVVSCTKKEQLEIVSVSEHKIMLNKQPYMIKGICYHPVPKGSDTVNFTNLTEDLALMKTAGINTIRVYAPIEDKAVLDEIANANIKVIIGFGYNQGGKNDILSGSFINYVNRFKNHAAILMWELGNEYNYHPEWFEGDIKNWYNTMNNAADLIHKNDSNHPVTTAHGDLPNEEAMALSTNIDVWGLNIYRWDTPESVFKEWAEKSNKPMYLSEAGADSFMTIAKLGYAQGENQQAQADANASILNQIFENTEICSGVTLFSFTDGWWKAGKNDVQDAGGWAPNSSGVPYDGTPNEEYWGIVDIDRNPKKTFEVVQQVYSNFKK